MNSKPTQQIKQIIAKIDTDKIVSYPQHFESKTLRRIIRYSKRVLDSNDDEKVFKLAVHLAYDLDTICDSNKAGYVKDEEEKKYWLELSEELFKHTIGVKK